MGSHSSILSTIAFLTLVPIIIVTSKRLHANLGEKSQGEGILRIIVCANTLLICVLPDFVYEKKSVLLVGIILYGLINLAMLIFGAKMPDKMRVLEIVVLVYFVLMLLIPFYSSDDYSYSDNTTFFGYSYSTRYYNCYHIKLFESDFKLGPTFEYDL